MMKTAFVAACLLVFCQDVGRLIEKLGSDAPEERESATEEIRKIGAAAVPPLKQALKTLQDAEIRTRIETLLAELDLPDPAQFYSCRREGRENSKARSGSTRATEEAVLAALRWLARHQNPDGGWSADKFTARCTEPKCDGAGEPDYDTGLTGLVLLAFLGAGYAQDSKDEYPDSLKKEAPLKFGPVVESGLKCLISKQARDGCLGERGMKYLYNHAVATAALAEAFGMTRADFLRAPAQQAVDFLVTCQNPGKGWRYSDKCGDNDTSVTGWAVMALKSAESSSLKVPRKTFEGALAWFDEATQQSGLYEVGYTARGTGKVFVPGRNENFDHHPAMSAVAVTARLFTLKRNTDLSVRAVMLLIGDLPEWKTNKIDCYYWYYATQALFQYDGPEGPLWKRWNQPLINALVPSQHTSKDGCRVGSWDPAQDRWGAEGGRVYLTALNALTLGTYFRYPLVCDKK